MGSGHARIGITVSDHIAFQSERDEMSFVSSLRRSRNVWLTRFRAVIGDGSGVVLGYDAAQTLRIWGIRDLTTSRLEALGKTVGETRGHF
jgi:hypothetical protein